MQPNAIDFSTLVLLINFVQIQTVRAQIVQTLVSTHSDNANTASAELGINLINNMFILLIFMLIVYLP